MDAGAELLFISIHALRKESDRAVVARPLPLGISIHALRKESDMTYESTAADIIFQSTLSVRRATWRPFRGWRVRHFNPRSP